MRSLRPKHGRGWPRTRVPPSPDPNLPSLLERHQPDLVFYLAGADPYEKDQLGGLSLTLDGLRWRDELVFHSCAGAGVPVAVTLAGGYAVQPDDTVEIHCNT